MTHLEFSELSFYPHFAGSLFLNCPETKTLFGFDETTDPSDPAFLKSPRFLSHAENLISMLDSALDMLGPDQETLTEILRGLGKRVSIDHMPLMDRFGLELTCNTASALGELRCAAENVCLHATVIGHFIAAIIW